MSNINLRMLANQQVRLTYAFIAIFIGQSMLPFTPLAGIVYVLFFALVVMVFKVTHTMGKRAAFAILTSAAMLVPILNLIVLVVVNLEACRILRRAGLRVGTIGVDANGMARIGEITGHCTKCWHKLTERESAYCAECGRRM